MSLGSPLAEQAVGNISIIGRGYNILKSKSHESAYRLHECRSQMVLCPEPDSQAFAESKPAEGLLSPFPSLSCTSFISAKSDLSASKSMQKEIQELEPNIKNEVNYTTSDELIANHEHPSAFKSPVENECSSRVREQFILENSIKKFVCVKLIF